MSPWWRRDKPTRSEERRSRTEAAPEWPDVTEFTPPQEETLFDAEQYESSLSSRPEPADVTAFAEVVEVPPVSEPVTAPVAGADAEPASEPDPEPELDPIAAAVHVLAPDPESLVPEEPVESDTADAPGADDDRAADTDDTPHSRHVRRRKAGRTRRAGAAESANAVTPVSQDAASVAVTGLATSDTKPPLAHRAGAAFARAGRRLGAVLVIIAVLFGSLYGVTLGVNALARWNARRIAAILAGPASPAEDNLLVIGVSDGVAVGFTALKAERASKRVLGIAIPDGAFVEVPGQGFERVGASYAGGPEVSKDAVTNYLGVPFKRYVIVDGATYQTLLKDQNISQLMGRVAKTDLTADQKTSFTEFFAGVGTKDVWIVPLPVKPVAVGDQRYFEPQRAQVADLLLQWWGVQPGQQKATPRVIVYNGVGTPGIAGVAAQQLIRSGLRVVDSGNADNFDHATTLILLYHGTSADAEAVRKALGVGQVVVQSATQELTDMIVIIGADYRPPTSDASTVPTEGVQ